MRKRLMIIGASSLAVIGSAGAIGLSSVSAASSPSGSTLADKIANTFHLNKADVQKVIDQNKADNQAAAEQKYLDRLSKAVTDGKITAAQKQLIIDKHNEVIKALDGLKDKTAQERKTALQTQRDELKTWADQNKIPLNLVEPMHRGFGPRTIVDDTSTTSQT